MSSRQYDMWRLRTFWVENMQVWPIGVPLPDECEHVETAFRNDDPSRWPRRQLDNGESVAIPPAHDRGPIGLQVWWVEYGEDGKWRPVKHTQ